MEFSTYIKSISKPLNSAEHVINCLLSQLYRR